MNAELSRRIGKVMSTMIPDLSPEQHLTVLAAVEAADDFDSLPAWIRARVEKAEASIGVSGLRASTPRD